MEAALMTLLTVGLIMVFVHIIGNSKR